MGVRGSSTRANRFSVLSFVRTGIAIIHTPLITSVLASSIPCQIAATATTHETCDDNVYDADAATLSDGVSRLFFLADRTWSGLVGWLEAAATGRRRKALSVLWIHLALIVAIAYVGVPLLTLSYEFKPTSDWKMGQFVDVPTAFSKATADYTETLAQMRNTKNWMQGGLFMDAHDSTGVDFFRSVNDPQPSLNDAYGRPDWADGLTLITSSMQSAVLGQVPHVAGALASVSCGMQRYNLANPVAKFDVGIRSPLLVTLPETASESSQSDALACTDACFKLQADAHVPLSCVERRSTVTTMLSDFNFDLVGYSPFANCSWEGPNFSNTSIPHYGFKSGATSCIQQRDSSFESQATIQMAIREPESWTKVVTCNVSIAFRDTTVNTFDHKYLAATSASAVITSSQASTAQLLNLTMEPFVNFFHEGPPHLAACPTTDGFNWISYAKDNIDRNKLLDSDDAPTFPSASCEHEIQSSWAATLRK